MVSFGAKPAEGVDPWKAARDAYDTTLENAIVQVETTANAALPIKGDLGTASLDTITTPGIYFQGSSANATPANGYPVARPGVLKVSPNASGNVLHEYTYEQGGYSLSTKRWKWSGSWNTWRLDAINRIDQTAGRAMYTWDNLSNREQLFYADTGWRNVTAASDPGLYNAFFAVGVTELAALPLLIRRVGYKVFARVGVDKTATGNVTCSGAFPAGFGVVSGVATPSYASNSAAEIVRVFPTPTGIIYQRPSAATGCSGMVEWFTDDPWPTALPGTAFGTIPNA